MEPLDRAAVGVLRTILDAQPLTDAKVTFAWTIAAGPGLARAATVSRGEDGVVRVRPESAAWQREIQRAAPLLRSRMADLLGPGVVERLDVVAADDRSRSRRQRSSATARDNS